MKNPSESEGRTRRWIAPLTGRIGSNLGVYRDLTGCSTLADGGQVAGRSQGQNPTATLDAKKARLLSRKNYLPGLARVKRKSLLGPNVSPCCSIVPEKKPPMHHQTLTRGYHATRRDFGFQNIPTAVFLLQQQTPLSLIELRTYSVECMRVAIYRTEQGQLDIAQVYDWENPEVGLTRFFIRSFAWRTWFIWTNGTG
jgi:hypothetical protein